MDKLVKLADYNALIETKHEPKCIRGIRHCWLLGEVYEDRTLELSSTCFRYRCKYCDSRQIIIVSGRGTVERNYYRG